MDYIRSILHSLKNSILYGGLERAAYRELIPDVQEANRKNLQTYSGLSAALFAVLVAANLIAGSWTMANQLVYALCMVVSGLFYVGTRLLLSRHKRLSTLFFYLFLCFLYVFALRITVLHPDKPAVTGIVLLLVLPLLFTDRPLNFMVMTVLFTALFSVTTFLVKDQETARTDLWNGISFGGLALVIEVIISGVRVQSMANTRHIAYLGEHDVLTGLRNRNSFETSLENYAQSCRHSLACCYCDANGLHQINNTQGHRAGDKLLISVAAVLHEAFGEDVYRIGGDEFVIFRPDCTAASLLEEMKNPEKSLADQGYSISYGCAQEEKTNLGIDDLINQAETEMYRFKRSYYDKLGLSSEMR